MSGSDGHSYVERFEEPPDCFPKQLPHFIFPQAENEGSDFSTSSPTLVTICLFFYFSHPHGREVVSHCIFYFHFDFLGAE